tara:strand:+ start:828 stop:1781 length:954 start_codon:yes stop_codon:yes gene_type:complete
MSQNDFTLANQGFPSMRADMNDAFQALASSNSGTSGPTTSFAHQLWYDTTNSKMMIRNSANSLWVDFTISGNGDTFTEKTTTYTASAGDHIIADTSTGPWTLTLPATPSSGDVVTVAASSDWATNFLTIGRNGSTIEGSPSNLVLKVGGTTAQFIFASNNWSVFFSIAPITTDVVTEGYVQAEATWETGTGTSDTLVSPAKVKASIVANANTNPTMVGTPIEDIKVLGGTTVTLSPTEGSIQTHALSGSTIYSDNFAAGNAITIMITTATAHTVTWPTMTWVNNGAVAPDISTTAPTVVALWKVSTVLYGALVGSVA